MKSVSNGSGCKLWPAVLMASMRVRSLQLFPAFGVKPCEVRSIQFSSRTKFQYSFEVHHVPTFPFPFDPSRECRRSCGFIRTSGFRRSARARRSRHGDGQQLVFQLGSFQFYGWNFHLRRLGHGRSRRSDGRTDGAACGTGAGGQSSGWRSGLPRLQPACFRLESASQL